MVTYDETAAVYEAWADTGCREYLGCFDTYAVAREAVAATGADLRKRELTAEKSIRAALRGRRRWLLESME
jgi:hypothetical protein